jgi:hypothetical protein
VERARLKKEREKEKEEKVQELAQRNNKERKTERLHASRKLPNKHKSHKKQPQRKLHQKGRVRRSAVVVEVVVKVGNHPKHHHPKSPEQGAGSPFPANSNRANWSYCLP